MKALIVALLLSATAVHANYETVPKPYSCAQAQADGDQILIVACGKFADTKRVRKTFSTGNAKSRGPACGDTPGNCSLQPPVK